MKNNEINTANKYETSLRIYKPHNFKRRWASHFLPYNKKEQKNYQYKNLSKTEIILSLKNK